MNESTPMMRVCISCFFWNKRQNNCSFIQLVFLHTSMLFRLGVNQTRNMKSTLPRIIFSPSPPSAQRGKLLCSDGHNRSNASLFDSASIIIINMAFPGNVENMGSVPENIPNLAKLRAALVKNIRSLLKNQAFMLSREPSLQPCRASLLNREAKSIRIHMVVIIPSFLRLQ